MAQSEQLLWWSSSSGRIEFQMTLADAHSVSQPGKDASEDVKALRKKPYIIKQLDEIDPADLRRELGEYGTWSEQDLALHDMNVDRLLWIIGCDIRDDPDNREN